MYNSVKTINIYFILFYYSVSSRVEDFPGVAFEALFYDSTWRQHSLRYRLSWRRGGQIDQQRQTFISALFLRCSGVTPCKIITTRWRHISVSCLKLSQPAFHDSYLFRAAGSPTLAVTLEKCRSYKYDFTLMIAGGVDCLKWELSHSNSVLHAAYVLL